MNLPRVPFLLLVLVLGMCACTPQPQPASSEDTGAPAIVDDFPASLQVAGTEPFWGIRIDGETLLYSTPETIDAPRRLEGTRRVDGDGLHFTGQEGEDAFALDVRREPCSDGMSDIEYPYLAEFVFGAQTLQGCARDPSVEMAPQ